jgi:hypothetical protein
MADTADLSALVAEPQQGVPVWPEAADRCPVFYPAVYPALRSAPIPPKEHLFCPLIRCLVRTRARRTPFTPT